MLYQPSIFKYSFIHKTQEGLRLEEFTMYYDLLTRVITIHYI